MNREKLAKMLMEISQVEGAGVFQEHDGSISFNGINQKTYDAFRKKKGLPPKDVRSIPVGETLDLVEQEFINVHGINKIPEEYLPVVFDTSFNSGPRNAAMLLQRTVGAEEDGIIGPKTLKKLEEFSKENNFIESYSDSRTSFILDSQSPSVIENRKGLLNRINFVRDRELSKFNQASGGVTTEQSIE